MKKLMIAAAIVCAAAFAQAASIDWQFTETAQVKNNPLDLSGYTAYLFTQSAWEGIDKTGGVIKADDFKGWADTATITTTSMGGGAGVKYDTLLQDTTGTSGNYYIILSDGDGVVASAALAATQYDDPTVQHDAAKWSIGATDTPITSTSYTIGNVPEPTSGLLLLLGVAGLALRRRRA